MKLLWVTESRIGTKTCTMKTSNQIKSHPTRKKEMKNNLKAKKDYRKNLIGAPHPLQGGKWRFDQDDYFLELL